MVYCLKAGGKEVNIWLRNILNAVVDLEVIPEVLKRGVIVPVYINLVGKILCVLTATGASPSLPWLSKFST